jgi:hypothetical protein
MIYTSSRVYFHIKNPISNSFNQFNTVLDRASFTGKFRVLGVSFLRHRAQCSLDGGLICDFFGVSLEKFAGRRGIG